MVKTTANKEIGPKLIVRNMAAEWWDEEVKEAMKVRRKAYERSTSTNIRTGWEPYAKPEKRSNIW